MNNLPNLSEWHEVPKGTTIPEGTLWVADFGSGVIGLYTHEVDTGTHAPRTKFYTEKPIERSLAQVIEAACNDHGDWEAAAQAARDFLATEEPRYVVDYDNDKWVLNNEGTYDCLDVIESDYQNRALDYIRTNFGIKED